MALDDWTCQECGHRDHLNRGRTLSVDHVEALADGGQELPPLGYLATLCTPCHGTREAARQRTRRGR